MADRQAAFATRIAAAPMAPVCRLLCREKESGEDIIQGKQFPVHNGESERRPAAACAQFFTVCF
jgi:hypothetical protein